MQSLNCAFKPDIAILQYRLFAKVWIATVQQEIFAGFAELPLSPSEEIFMVPE